MLGNVYPGVGMRAQSGGARATATTHTTSPPAGRTRMRRAFPRTRAASVQCVVVCGRAVVLYFQLTVASGGASAADGSFDSDF